ncbi:transporter substrate-binding domain-containing protein [Rugamonas rubra]|uniref:ABC-type amino acid transport substrate-binding protein n=1 Tax=Rugamonas rubra TaxID=758825 RepID=A0A1I4QIE7_9BURK|nr:transporter substrate-binding domain-containing protein [Rugamonas rubra]SFM39831.1 ABC-type amino acid transport substrate-binding protein [Rugamonas rubra]
MSARRPAGAGAGRAWPPRLALLLALLLAATAQARSLAEIRRSGELRVCIASDHPASAVFEPAGCRHNCKASGTVAELTGAFANTLGRQVKPRFERLYWDEQFFNQDGRTVREASYTPQALASGKCDLYPANLVQNEWRLKKLDFVILFPSRLMAIVARRKAAQVKGVADLAGKLAGVNRDTAALNWVEQQNRGAFAANPARIEYLLSPALFTAVDAGAVDFILIDADIALWAGAHQLKHASVAFPVGPTDLIGWGFRKDDKDLQKAAQRFFDDGRRRPDSAPNQIWKRHFGRSLTDFIDLMAAFQ